MDIEQLKFPIGKFSGTRPQNAGERVALIAILRGQPANLRASVAGLNDEQLDTPYRPDGWTVRQVVHHVADSHMNAYARTKHGLTEENYEMRGYKQPEWASTPENDLPIDGSLKYIELLHDKWTYLLSNMSAEQYDRKLTHNERPGQDLDLNWLIALYAWHGTHHIAHITKLREQMGW